MGSADRSGLAGEWVMNIFEIRNSVLTALLIVVYLVLPAATLGIVTPFEERRCCGQTAGYADDAVPCNNCPCSGGDGAAADCCDTAFCSCSCHIPQGQYARLIYAPVMMLQSFAEPLPSPLQVYRSIFVPPQNHS